MDARRDRQTMRSSFLVVAILSWLTPEAAHAGDASIDVPSYVVSSLRVTTDEGVFSAIVEEDREAGYNVEITCVSGCLRAISRRESVGDSPLGLFTRDQDNLLFSTWSAGSAYRVRVWALNRSGIVEVAELSSRGRPGFGSDRLGRATIRTFEGESGISPLRPVLWTYWEGAFIRSNEAMKAAARRE